jgi:hypothetical protein
MIMVTSTAEEVVQKLEIIRETEIAAPMDVVFLALRSCNIRGRLNV